MVIVSLRGLVCLKSRGCRKVERGESQALLRAICLGKMLEKEGVKNREKRVILPTAQVTGPVTRTYHCENECMVLSMCGRVSGGRLFNASSRPSTSRPDRRSFLSAARA